MSLFWSLDFILDEKSVPKLGIDEITIHTNDLIELVEETELCWGSDELIKGCMWNNQLCLVFRNMSICLSKLMGYFNKMKIRVSSYI